MNLNAKKIKSLGELETEIMEVIWKLGNASVRDVLTKLSKNKKIAYTTVMTVMSRLNDKGVLKRKLDNDAYIYSPTETKKNFFASLSEKAIRSIIQEFGEEVAVAQFINILENKKLKNDKELKKKLKKIINT